MQGTAVDTTPIPLRLLTRGFRGYFPVLIGTQNTVIPNRASAGCTGSTSESRTQAGIHPGSRHPRDQRVQHRSAAGRPSAGPVMRTDLCTRPVGIERDVRDRHQLAGTQARQPPRPGGMPETKRDVGDLRRAAHNPATATRAMSHLDGRMITTPRVAVWVAVHSDTVQFTGVHARDLSCGANAHEPQ